MWDAIWFAPVSPSPMCVLRILYGILSIINGLLYLPDFLTWYGPHGVLPAKAVLSSLGPRPSILLYLNFTDGETMALLWLFLVFSVLVSLGLWTRFSLFIVWMLSLTFNSRNTLMFHQVDSILRLIGFVLLLSPAGAMYSIDRWLSRRKGDDIQPLLYSPWAQRLLQFQVACIYFKAFWGKILGESWRQGVAVYFATHFTVRHPVPGFMDNLLFYKMATYYTLVIEFSMWTLIWIQPLTKWVLLGATILHLGIEWCINLDLLEWSVLITYVAFLKPAEIERAITVVGDFLRRRKRTATP
jgi:hypothetical protein